MGGGKTKLIEDAEAMKISASSSSSLMAEFVGEGAVVMQPNVERASQSFAVVVQTALEKVGSDFR